MVPQDAVIDRDAREPVEAARPDPGDATPAGGPPPSSLRRLALRGTLWTVGGYGLGQVLRLAGNLVLSRLLFPEAFGVMAIISVYMLGLELFSDVGIGPSVIQNPRGDEPRFYNTAWTVQILRGLLLSLVAVLLAWPVASAWYRKPEIAPLMVVAGLGPLIAGFGSPKIFLANRRLDLGSLTLLELGTQVLNLGSMVILAWLTRSVWALVFGSLIGATARMVLSHLILAGRAGRPGWDRAVLGELFRFGRWIFLGTAIHFLSSQGDRLLLGRYLGASMLGVYNIAFMLGAVAFQLVGAIAERVLFPVFSRVAHEGPGRVAEAYDRVRRRLDLLCLPLIGLLIGVAPMIVALLYDDRYQAAGPLLRILGTRGALGCLLATQGPLITALGAPQYATLANGLKALMIFAGIPLGFASGGMAGAAWVVALSELPAGVALWWAMGRRGLLRPRTELRALGLCAAGAALGFAISLGYG